jgi:hypothetical protein
MQANPDKFQVLAVGKKTFDKNMKICIQNSTLGYTFLDVSPTAQDTINFNLLFPI